MNGSRAMVVVHHSPLSGFERIAAWVTWIVAGLLFLRVGWFAVAPDDPMGAVSMLCRSGSFGMFLQAALLGIVASAGATVVVGGKLADVGAFAASVGLAAVSVKGASSSYLLIQAAEGQLPAGGVLGVMLAFEAIMWAVVVLGAIVAGGIVRQWIAPSAHADAQGAQHIAPTTMACFDLPLLGQKLTAGGRTVETSSSDGLMHAAVVCGGALLAMAVLGSGMADRSVQHGQACFLVAASVSIGCYAAHSFFLVRSALWSLLGVWAFACAALIWGSLRSGGAPVPVPSSAYLRALPIQYVAVGSAAAILFFWYAHASDKPLESSDDGDE